MFNQLKLKCVTLVPFFISVANLQEEKIANEQNAEGDDGKVQKNLRKISHSPMIQMIIESTNLK